MLLRRFSFGGVLLAMLAAACGDSSESSATAPATAGGTGGTEAGAAGVAGGGAAGTSAEAGGGGSAGDAGTGGTSSAGSGGSGGSAGAAPAPGVDTTVAAFDKTQIFFNSTENKRVVDASAAFPATGTYEKITLHLSLSCPSEGCDPWDRFGTLGVVTAKGATPEQDTVVEVARFITPYHVGASWDLDVTDLRPLLTGDLTLRAFIDTWVGPGSGYGGGWALSASFEMKGGTPEKLPVAVVPVWSPRQVVYGDPAKPIATSVPAADLDLPAGSSYALRAFVTGHGQGNKQNCAEFCGKKHTISVGLTPHEQKIWRDDCKTTAAPNQQGTWQYSRAGWCPGADVYPWMIDVTADISSSKATLSYDVEAFENTCRPDASSCSGCTLGATCDYDGGAHTEPNYQFSALLIAYQ